VQVDVSQVKSTGITYLQFDLQWENSWRLNYSPANHDAAWVFIKYRRANDVLSGWNHLYLNPANHSAPSTAVIKPALLNPSDAHHVTDNPYTGAFIYRASAGVGVFSVSEVKVAVNTPYPFADKMYDFQVHAIEMVYVPKAPFYVGDGNDGSVIDVKGELHDASSTLKPFYISNENVIVLGGNVKGNLGNNNALGMNPSNIYTDDFNASSTQTLPAAYPKGYNAFYAMKYEITQQQYVAFLNSLTRTQQNNRTETNLSIGISAVSNPFVMSNTATVESRNGIRCDAAVDALKPITFYNDLNANGIANEAADGLHLAANFISWMDGAAYLDWAGLRPMTELEFEKICRGVRKPVMGEYAWGTTTINESASSYTLINNGTDNELVANVSTSSGNAQHLAMSASGVARVGMFAAASGNAGRAAAGAAYYGAMDLSSNVRERVVNIGRPEGRAFTGLHGNGVLSKNGHANVAFWPGSNAGEVTAAQGSGYKGGYFLSYKSFLTVSNRFNATTVSKDRLNNFGFRGVRAE